MQDLIELIERALRGTQNDPRFILAGLALIFAGLFKAVQDRLSNEGAFSTSVFRGLRRDFWLKSESWVRKYKRYKTGSLVVAEYDAKNRPIHKPAFTFLGLRSDKALVMFTDGWHLAQFFTWSCVSLAVTFATGLTGDDWRFWVFWVLTRGIVTGTFSTFYDSVFRARRSRRNRSL